MSKSSFSLVFEGDVFDSGEIDVRGFAPALMALGDILQRANRAINGSRAEATLRLKATDKGSFAALLTLDVSFLTAISDLLDTLSDNPDGVTAAKDLIALLLGGGAVASGTVIGLLKTLQWLRGARPDKVTDAGNGTTIIVKDGGTVIVDNRTMILLSDLPTREAVEVFSKQALDLPGIESLRLEATSTGESISLERGDRASLAVPAPEPIEPITESNDREMLLRIVTSAFRDGYKWRFSDGGDKPFTADVQDIDFVDAVAAGKVSLTANDTLRCLVREQQLLTSSGLSKEMFVLKVIEHISAPVKLRLL